MATAAVAVDDPESPATDPSPRDRLIALPWGWLGPLAVAAVAGLLVFYRLGSPDALIWDETYYAKDGWALLNYGVEHNWQADPQGNPANPRFLAGNPEAGLAPGGEWAAHPPMGKWLIAAGIAIFGTDPLGFRLAGGVAGVLSVLLLARITRRMTGSTALGCAAGLLMALDGSWLVSSRTAMLDVFLLLWVLAGFGCLVADRDRTRARLAERAGSAGLSSGAGFSSSGGPFLRHGWRLGAAVCFGLACGTKWSGAYAMAFFLVLALVWDAMARKETGVERPWRGMLRLDLLPSLLQVWALAAAVYLLGWWGWFASGTGLQKAIFGQNLPGFQRNWAELHPSGIWPGFLDPVRSLWHYHAMTLDFHGSVTSPNPGQSWPWEWPYVGRPAAMYSVSSDGGQGGCGAAACVSKVTDIGTPAVWWVSIAALLAMPVLTVLFRDWRAVAAAGGYLAAWLPWFPAAFDDRTMYSTYTLLMLPFAVLAIVLLFQRIGDRYRAGPDRRAVTWGGVAYLLIVAVNLYYLYPILTAVPIPEAAHDARMWLPGWS